MTTVTATTGRSTGSRNANRLREQGELPGVVYGLGKDPVTVNVTYTELRDALKGAAGLNTILTLDVDGTQEEVIVKEIQRDPIKRTVRHADFLRVDENTKVTITIPVVISGRSEAVADAGAIIEQKMHSLKVLCNPYSIPNQINADVSNMTLDRRLALGDLDLGPGVTTKVGMNITVAAPVVPRGLKSDEEADVLLDEEGNPIEPAEGAEGGEAAEAGGDDASGDDE